MTEEKNDSPTKDRYVGFIDIMGFKDFIARNDHEVIYEKLKKLISEYKREVINVPAFSEDGIKIYIFSDSIILFSDNDTKDEKKELLRSMRILMERLLIDTIPFRGAIAFGKITLDEDNSIFFGQPLIDAYLLAEELSFYGIALHHSAETLIKKDNDFNKRFLLYESPMKNGAAKQHLISPFMHFFDKHKTQEIFNNLRLLTSGSLRKYIDNTEIFLTKAEENQKKYNPKKNKTTAF